MIQRSSAFAAAVAAAALLANHAHGHIMQMYPISRQYSYGPVFKEWDFPGIDYCPHCYNARGPKFVKERAKAKTDPAVLDEYGGGDEFPLYFGDFADNGNYLETDEIAKRHGICGDPEQNADEESNVYSTANIGWDVLGSFKSGEVLEMDIIMNAYHWGHCEFFLCNADEMDDPDGLPTQECFNRYPLTRAADDGDASPIDPNYPGRYYVDPECRAGETEQGSPEGAPEGYNIKMRYVLPDIECDRCVLQMHIGYEEFNPPSWPGTCAPNKSDWIELNRSICGEDGAYPEEFWACSDISLTSDGSAPPPTPATTPATPVPEAAPTPTPVDPPTPTPVDPPTPTPVDPPTPTPVDPPTPAPVDPPTPAPVDPPTPAPVDPPTPSPVDPPTPAPVDPPTPAPVDPPAPTPVDPPTPSEMPVTAPTDEVIVCSTGIPGIESSDGAVCCPISCTQCGGAGCSTVGLPEYGAESCCSSDVLSAGVSCSVSEEAPCVLDDVLPPAETPSPSMSFSFSYSYDDDEETPEPTTAPATEMPAMAPTPEPVMAPTAEPVMAPTPEPVMAPTAEPVSEPAGDVCSNGIPGIQSDNSCCLAECGACGGSGCAEFGGGLGEDNCCAVRIEEYGELCSVALAAPCYVDDGSAPPPTPAETEMPVAMPTERPATPAPVDAPTPAPVDAPTPSPVDPPTPAPADPPTPAPVDAPPTPSEMPVTAPTDEALPFVFCDAAFSRPQLPRVTPLTVTLPCPRPQPVVVCSTGIRGIESSDGAVCCPVGSTQCGGEGCSIVGLPDYGPESSCQSIGLSTGVSCSVSEEAPCVLDETPEPTSAPATEMPAMAPTPEPVIAPTAEPVIWVRLLNPSWPPLPSPPLVVREESFCFCLGGVPRPFERERRPTLPLMTPPKVSPEAGPAPTNMSGASKITSRTASCRGAGLSPAT
ncbi:unnamed protein product [Ectocarpus fasciculatus]